MFCGNPYIFLKLTILIKYLSNFYSVSVSHFIIPTNNLNVKIVMNKELWLPLKFYKFHNTYDISFDMQINVYFFKLQ